MANNLKKMTLLQIVQYIEKTLHDGMEPAEPAGKIVAYLREYNGKKFTVRDEKKLKEIDPSIRVEKRAGMTQLRWKDPLHPDAVPGLLLAYNEGAPLIDAEWVVAHNAHAFEAREQRNASREKALNDAKSIREAAEAIHDVQQAAAKLAQLFEYGGVLHEARFDMGAILPERVI